MRKVDPEGVRKDFIKAVTSVESLTILLEDVPHAAHQALELQVLSAVVYWEGFMTDLFVAYVNRDSTRFATDLGERIGRSVRDKFGAEAAAHTAVALPAHLDRATVAALLDHSGRNLSFNSAKDLAELASAYLPDEASSRFGQVLGVAERAEVDAWLAIRNYVAHRSQAAWTKMNKVLADENLAWTLRRWKNGVNSVGKYLAATAEGAPRATHIFNGMRSLAKRL